MKKALIYIVLLLFIFSIGNTNAFYSEPNLSSIESFINSPSLGDLDKITDKKLQVCERIFLEAFMRREFSENENKLCSDIFEAKIEAQLNYMRFVMGERGIY